MNHSGKKKKKYCPSISRKRDPAKLYTCDRERVSNLKDEKTGTTHKNDNCPGNSSAALESNDQSRIIAGGVWRYEREVIEADNYHTWAQTFTQSH